MSEYIIKKGKHSASGLHFGVHFGIKEQRYRVRFSKECLYQPLNWENDYNKLCGWSYGMHHNNSIRVCFRPYLPLGASHLYYTPTKIELCVYVYENKTRRISETTIIVNVEEDLDLLLKYWQTTNTVGAKVGYGNTMYVRDYKAKPTWGYRLYPFFGGNDPSPHDMGIELERL